MRHYLSTEWADYVEEPIIYQAFMHWWGSGWRIHGVGDGRGGSRGGQGSLTTKNEAPAPKFYKIEAPVWQF